MFRSSKKQAVIDETVQDLNEDISDIVLARSLDTNMALINDLFCDVDIFKSKYIKNKHLEKPTFCIAYSCGVADKAFIGENIIEPVSSTRVFNDNADTLTALKDNVLQIPDIEQTDKLLKVVGAICYGDTVLFTDGESQALILGTQSFTTRAISEPENERVISGPKEGFTESIITSMSMLRRRVRTNKLKIKCLELGERTKTMCSVCYMEDVVNKKILNELYKRLEKIKIDAVLDTNYIAELIGDAQHSPFRTTGITERPDTVIARILEGRIAVIVDGSPTVLTLPFLFVENFQSSEDYYMNFYYSSFSRMIRIFGFMLTLLVPGLFIAVEAYHHEMLPTQLLLNIATERQGSPLPANIEAFVMLIIFDILRETGVRMPSNIGQALSIVGALVIGQSAVEAKMVAAPMIIIVALTGITNLLVPRLGGPVIILRYLFLLAASLLGFFGLVLAMSAAMIHILNLRSFGIPQLMAAGNLRFQEVKDSFFRAPWQSMRLRQKRLSSNRTRNRSENDTP